MAVDYDYDENKKTENGEFMFCQFDQFSAKGYSHLSLSDCYKL